MEQQTIKIHRLGSVTFGVVLIALGTLFLVNLFLPSLNYMIIYRFWPIILIMLGIEVLCGSRYKNYKVLDQDGKVIEQSKVIYDLASIFLTMSLTIFTVALAWIDWAYTYHMNGFYIG